VTSSSRALGVTYLAETAGSLPSVVSGHAARSTHHRIKHGIAPLLLDAAAFVYAWFTTGPRAHRFRCSPGTRADMAPWRGR
jgi:hypothetical protein